MSATQFAIADHYDMMEQLDQDVHHDDELSRSEVQTAFRLMGHVPNSVFLPCFGTGRHIPFLIERGVRRIVGVDLSPKCVAKAQRLFGHLPGVQLIVGDLAQWQTTENFNATLLLGHSFADCIDEQMLTRISLGMTKPIKTGGKFLMDYIGRNYLDWCATKTTSIWNAEINGQPVKDSRTPTFDPASGVMTISVRATSVENESLVWEGFYQKRILSRIQIQNHFTHCGIDIRLEGHASDLNYCYYHKHNGELGMIGQSDWWVGTKLI